VTAGTEGVVEAEGVRGGYPMFLVATPQRRVWIVPELLEAAS
jgi:hypothetical protein